MAFLDPQLSMSSPGVEGHALPRLSLVVTTVGRSAEFARLLSSLRRLISAVPFELILVDQDADRTCTRMLERQEASFPWRTATSGPGASVGRNVGIRLARGELIAFPDDDCWYDPFVIARAVDVLDRSPEMCAVSGRALTKDGAPSLLRWLPKATIVTPSNLYRASIEFAVFFRRAAVQAVGGFDEGMGPGSAGWCGAGEGSDLILRILGAGMRVCYDPAIVVYHDDVREAPPETYVRKMFLYGYGQGHVWRRHRIPLTQVLYVMARRLGAAAVHKATRRAVLSRAELAYTRGCVLGLANIDSQRASSGRGLWANLAVPDRTSGNARRR